MEQKTEKKPKLWLAILVAIGLGLAGCTLWGVLYYFDYIEWIAAYLVVFGAAWGYQKFNLKLDKKGYFIISAIAVVEIAVTMLITLVIAVMTTLGTSFFDSFALLPQLFEAFPELTRTVITDTVLSLVFIALGLVTYFITEKRKAKQSSEVEKQLEINKTEQNSESKPEQPQVETESKPVETKEEKSEQPKTEK